MLDILNFPLMLAEFAKVQNYVGTSRVEHFVDMHKVNEKCQSDVFYNPVIFSGLVYKMKNHRLTALIFASGKYVMTGS